MITCKAITARLRAEGLPLELVKGEGYFYFVFDDGAIWESHSIYVCFLNQLSVDRWLEAGRDFAKEVKA